MNVLTSDTFRITFRLIIPIVPSTLISTSPKAHSRQVLGARGAVIAFQTAIHPGDATRITSSLIVRTASTGWPGRAVLHQGTSPIGMATMLSIPAQAWRRGAVTGVAAPAMLGPRRKNEGREKRFASAANTCQGEEKRPDVLCHHHHPHHRHRGWSPVPWYSQDVVGGHAPGLCVSKPGLMWGGWAGRRGKAIEEEEEEEEEE